MVVEQRGFEHVRSDWGRLVQCRERANA